MVHVAVSESRTIVLTIIKDDQAIWVVLDELHKEVLFCLSAQSLKDSLLICHAQQRPASSAEEQLLGISPSSECNSLEGVLVELRGTCSIVRYLTGNQALANSLAKIPSLPGLEKDHETGALPTPVSVVSEPSGETP